MSVDVRCIRIKAAKMLMHHLYFGSEHLVLFVCVTADVRISLKPLDFGMKLAFLVLRASDVLNSYAPYMSEDWFRSHGIS